MADLATYRHRVTGLVSELEAGIAGVFADVLEKVEPGTKPLAYVPLSAEAVASVADTGADDDTAEPEEVK